MEREGRKDFRLCFPAFLQYTVYFSCFFKSFYLQKSGTGINYTRKTCYNKGNII